MTDLSDLDLMRGSLHAHAASRRDAVTISRRTAARIADWLDDYAEILSHLDGGVVDDPATEEQVPRGA